MRCPSCGEEVPERFRLCGYCGAELAPAPPPQEVRKTVSVVFCDLVGSTTLGERVDSESLREVLNRYFAEMRRVLDRHGGTVEKYIGDAVMAVFGIPRVHEDDALRAVRAATGMQQVLVRLNVDLERVWGVRLANRIGITTGEVVTGDAASRQRLVTGDVVNVAARLEAAAPPGGVLVDARTERLVRDAVEAEAVEPLSLKGKSEPVPAWLIHSIRGQEGYSRRQDAAMVGREAELAALVAALAAARASRACRLAVVLGDAGLGKSRLARELVERDGRDALVLRGRCLPYGEGITFWPVGEMVRGAAGIQEDDLPGEARAKLDALAGDEEVAERLAAAIGLGETALRIDEMFWAVRTLLERMGQERPVIVVLEDLHWAEETLLDLVEHLLDTVSAAPVLLLGTARPELMEVRAAWRGREDVAVVALEPLTAGEAAVVATRLLGTEHVPGDVLAWVTEGAEGNPLFVEQMLSMLADEGLLRREGSTWSVGDLSALSVPPSILALLAARLDRLTDAERAALERASVVGQVFSREAVEALSEPAARDGVGTALSTLTRKQLVRPEPAAPGMEDAFRFPSILIRDAAYGGLLKRTRADLHERVADWTERVFSTRALEYEEIIGYHLEQAHRYRAGLGRSGEELLALGERGAERLLNAGRRAFARGDVAAAAKLLDRAVALLPQGSRRRVAALPDVAAARIEAGELGRADEALREAAEGAAALGDEVLAARAAVVQHVLRFLTDQEGWNEQVVAEVERLITVFERAGDDLGLARAWTLVGFVHGTACRFSAAEEASARALEHARRAGDRREEGRNLVAYSKAALYGPMPVPQAIVRCEEILERTGPERRARVLVLCALALLHAMAGEPARARDLSRSSRALAEELGGRMQLALIALDSGPVEMVNGDLEAAERELAGSYEALEAMGDRAYLSTVAALRAQVAADADRPEDAERYSRVSEEAASPDDVETQALWRAARAKALAGGGRLDAAQALAREAVALVEPTEQPALQGTMLLDLARVLAAAGRDREAAETAARAAERFAIKGDVVGQARAQALAAGRPALA